MRIFLSHMGLTPPPPPVSLLSHTRDRPLLFLRMSDMIFEQPLIALSTMNAYMYIYIYIYIYINICIYIYILEYRSLRSRILALR